MTVTVEPGIVLDALNAWLKPHGLWFPVDVSTSAQATLGGMAGNNSCGSRSIAYGNMVHNVLAIDAMLADGTEARFGAGGEDERARRRASRALIDGLRAIGARERDEIERRVPKVLRRVGGYNIDVFDPQSERPYTADGSVNLAHLLVGSEGTLAWSRDADAASSRRCRAPRARRRQLPDAVHARWSARGTSSTLGPSAVELVDRTMIDLARGNPAFRAVIDARADRRARRDPAGRVHRARTPSAPRRRARRSGAADGRPRPARAASCEMTDAGAQKALWEVRKAGLNIMMSMKGDGKPVSFIEDCAVPLEHLADYVDRLTEVFAQARHARHLVRACVGRHAARAADPRHARDGGATKMRAIAEEAARWCASTRARSPASTATASCAPSGSRWQFGPRLTRAFEEIKDALRSRRAA